MFKIITGIGVMAMVASEKWSDKSFIFVDTPMTWNDAQKYCETQFGTSLATITNQEQNEYLENACDPPRSRWYDWFK